MWDFFSLSLSLSADERADFGALCRERERRTTFRYQQPDKKASHGVICNTTAEEVFPCLDLR